ncbi:MAG: EthD domain-containing protein [Myxococcota bacterium]|nr:EthD domain-containing protein [Myxococcales bacterium]
MEKLVYALWKPTGAGPDAYRDALLHELVPALARAGAVATKVSVADSAVAAGAKLRIDGGLAPKDALVTFWLEQSQDVAPCDALLAAHAAERAGWLVVESRPLVSEVVAAAPGARTPGFSLCTCVAKREGLSHAEFLDVWYGVHRACAIETQSTFSYVRNEIVRAVTPGAPPFTAIVEEGFPIEALDDPAVFYDAEGDPARLRANAKRMLETCERFLDLARVSSHPMSQYRSVSADHPLSG